MVVATIDGLQCEITYDIIVWGTLNGVLVGPISVLVLVQYHHHLLCYLTPVRIQNTLYYKCICYNWTYVATYMHSCVFTAMYIRMMHFVHWGHLRIWKVPVSLSYTCVHMYVCSNTLCTYVHVSTYIHTYIVT